MTWATRSKVVGGNVHKLDKFSQLYMLNVFSKFPSTHSVGGESHLVDKKMVEEMTIVDKAREEPPAQ